MWRVILKTSRADGKNPIKAWKEHNADLDARCSYLDGLGLKALEYKSANGTDFYVELNEDGRFCGGKEKTLHGRVFNPNIPSEEVFTSPKAGAAEGIVYSTKPLSYMGELIENFSVRFAGGKVVGTSDATTDFPASRPVSPADLLGSIYELCGVNPDQPFPSNPIGLKSPILESKAATRLREIYR